MANGYPCPACNDADAELFAIIDQPDDADASRPAYCMAYACEACINDAKVSKGAPAIFAADDLTATNHQ